MKFEFSRQIFENYSNIKFHENPSSVSLVVPCGRVDRGEEVNSRFSQLSQHTLKKKAQVKRVEETDGLIRNLQGKESNKGDTEKRDSETVMCIMLHNWYRQEENMKCTCYATCQE